MADTLITGTTLVEKESRSIGDISIGGIIEWDDTFVNIPESFVLCDGATITDPLSSYNGSTVPNLNTNYINVNSASLRTNNPDGDDVSFDQDALRITTGDVAVSGGVLLPNGATITAFIIYGNAGASDETALLTRIDSTGGVTLMANTTVGTEDTTIISAVIDNETYSYKIETSSLSTNDALYGARITYTPRFKFIIRIK